jgi:hypothetical protein
MQITLNAGEKPHGSSSLASTAKNTTALMREMWYPTAL